MTDTFSQEMAEFQAFSDRVYSRPNVLLRFIEPADPPEASKDAFFQVELPDIEVAQEILDKALEEMEAWAETGRSLMVRAAGLGMMDDVEKLLPLCKKTEKHLDRLIRVRSAWLRGDIERWQPPVQMIDES